MNTPLLAARVDPELVAQLDALAIATGTTRSDLVRDGIRRVLAAADMPPALSTETGDQ